MSQRASELQVETQIGGNPVPPRLKPAKWTDRGDAWVADPGEDVTLYAKPSRAFLEDNKIIFPKEKFPTLDSSMQALKVLYPTLVDAEANPDGTYNLKNVDVFNEGYWNGHHYGPEQLDEMVRTYQEIGEQMKPYLKFGHDDRHDYQRENSLPALGWVKNLRREGGTLYADLHNLPEVVYRSALQKGYRGKSPEIYWNMLWHNGKVYPYALRAVALLGADLPANPTLNDLYKYSENPTQGDLHVYNSNLDFSAEAGTPSAAGQPPGNDNGKSNPEPVTVIALEVDAPPPIEVNTAEEVKRATDAMTGASTGGLPVLIEVFKNQLRVWRRPNGNVERPLSADYGSIVGTQAPDGDMVDCFVGPDADFQEAFILTINTPREREDKVLLGFKSIHDAVACAQHHYDIYVETVRPIALNDLKQQLTQHGSLQRYAREATPRLKDRDVRTGIKARLKAIDAETKNKIKARLAKAGI